MRMCVNKFRDKLSRSIQFVLPGLLLVPLLMSGCAQVPELKPEPEPVPAAVPKPVVKEPVKEVVEPPEPEPVQPDVAILLSSNASAYKNVAKMLTHGLDDHARVFTQTGNVATDNILINSIQSSSRSQVVAIGLRAAKAAQKLKDKQVVFSQVFNYGDYRLISPTMKAVSAMPSPEEMFNDWKQLSPGLSQVAVVTGRNLSRYIDRAKKAAKKQGIELIHRQVRTDKEFLYAVKQLPLSVQGHWLLPDNRVLSLRVLKDVMAFNTKSGKQTVVFNSTLLSLGGLFYVKPAEDEVSRLIIERLKASINKEEIPGDDVLPVTKNEKGINATVAAQLNITIPAKLMKQVHE